MTDPNQDPMFDSWREDGFKTYTIEEIIELEEFEATQLAEIRAENAWLERAEYDYESQLDLERNFICFA